MNFDDEFFEDEVRCGFYVPSIMKRVWAEQIEMLKKIDYACEKLGIRYVAACGTLLGAVRHHGFIPWDDDVDLQMTRKDYDIFAREAQKYLPKEYFVRTIDTDSSHTSLIIRVDNTTGTELNGAYLNAHCGSFYAAGIDIFPLDYRPVSPENDNALRQELHFLNEMREKAEKGINFVTSNDLKDIQRKCDVMLRRDRFLSNSIAKLQEKIIKKYCGADADSEAECEEYIRAVFYVEGIVKALKKEWYLPGPKLEFENFLIEAPTDHKAILTVFFGDYMVPVRGGSDHEYPYFCNTQKKIWEAAPELKYSWPKERSGITKQMTNPETTKDERRKTAVLMPVFSSDMEALLPIYNRLSADENWDVYIIPIPYLKRKFDRGFSDVLWDGREIEKDFPITRFDEFDFGKPRPDVIFFTDPFDSYNGAHSVHPFFYSENIRKFTDYLVYVPTFTVDVPQTTDATFAWTMEYFVKMPGVYVADRIEAPNEAMQEMYDKIKK